MVIARSLSECVEYIDTNTTFYIRPLRHRVMLRMHELDDADQVELLIRAGISGWKNMQHNGVPIDSAHETASIGGIEVLNALSLESFDALPLTIITKLSHEILRVNQVTEEQAGN